VLRPDGDCAGHRRQRKADVSSASLNQNDSSKGQAFSSVEETQKRIDLT
jgi:hypothetical protein